MEYVWAGISLGAIALGWAILLTAETLPPVWVLVIIYLVAYGAAIPVIWRR